VDPPLVTSAPPVLSRGTAAIVSAAAGLTFVLLTTWVARQGPAVPRVDEHIHSWVISHRGPGSVTFARAVTWGGVTTVALPALVLAGAVAARGGRDIKRRLQSGLLLVCVAGAGVYVKAPINAFAGRGRPPVADWAGAAGGSAFPSGHTTTAARYSRPWVPGPSLPESTRAGLVTRSGLEPLFTPSRWAGRGPGWQCTGPLMSSVAGSTALPGSPAASL
jgi:membrane-associated phospholipid phosphatase